MSSITHKYAMTEERIWSIQFRKHTVGRHRYNIKCSIIVCSLSNVKEYNCYRIVFQAMLENSSNTCE